MANCSTSTGGNLNRNLTTKQITLFEIDFALSGSIIGDLLIDKLTDTFNTNN